MESAGLFAEKPAPGVCLGCMEDLRLVEQVHLAGSSLQERATCGTSSTWALGSHSRIQREGNLERFGDIGTKDKGLEGYRHKWSAVGVGCHGRRGNQDEGQKVGTGCDSRVRWRWRLRCG